MYNICNQLNTLYRELDDIKDIDLGSEYRNTLLRGHIDGAKEHLNRVRELVGRKNLFMDRVNRLINKMVTVLLGIFIILVIFCLFPQLWKYIPLFN